MEDTSQANHNPSEPSEIDFDTIEVQQALCYAEANQERFLEELVQFLSIPSVGTKPSRREDTHAAAEWLAGKMSDAGVDEVRVIPTNKHPLVYAEWLNAGPDKPTVLIYGHYDVQPADPVEEWLTPPFEPTLKNNRLFARGAADDKGQLYIHVKSIESYLKGTGVLPVNVKFIFEGEEESGGYSLEAFVPKNKALLGADIGLISDTHILSPEQPSIVYGLRGICYAFIDIIGPASDLHSGSFGGGVNNPINALCHIIAKLKDEAGNILIPGFYDHVIPLTDEERQMLACYPLDENAWLKRTGAPMTWGEPEYTLVERLGVRPTLDVNGIVGGYTGQGAKTVLPSAAHAKVSMRLVPKQDPAIIFELFKEFVEKIAPPSVTVTCTYVHGSTASIVNTSVPAMKAVEAAYKTVFGNKPVYMREGGTLPVVSLLKRHLELETILMGFGLPDDHIHAPNERFYLPNYYRGIETSIRFLDNYARMAANGNR